MFKSKLEAVQNAIDNSARSSGREAKGIQLIAVTKFQPVETIQEAYHCGCRNFGESRVQEALDKIPVLPSNCDWHFIGPLQMNKVGKVLSAFSLIHSVDSLRLAEKISALSQQPTSILLEVNVSGESSKHGLAPEEWIGCLEKLNHLPHLKIRGLMTMAPFTQEENLIRPCFRKLSRLLEEWKREMKEPSIFKELSMGMSNDFPIAIQEGATMIRIGSALFN